MARFGRFRWGLADDGRRPGSLPVAVMVALAVVAVAAAGVVAIRHADASTDDPPDAEYVAADRFTAVRVPLPGPAASTGSWVSRCGRNENGHNNADNLVGQPGVPGGAMHMHDYVGNVATTATTTDQQLQRAATTCAAGDRSTYYWPSLRLIGSGAGPSSPVVAGNTGRILRPDAVLLQYRGNPVSSVIPMPALLRIRTGNASAVTTGGVNAEHVQWGCSGRPGFSTRNYPLCGSGQQVVRTFDFPSCWDGRRIDSPTHRAQVVFPDPAGVCPANTFAVPQLRMVIAYTVPGGRKFAIDTMPDQLKSPLTDHGDYIEVMPDALMNQIVDCVNSGRNC